MADLPEFIIERLQEQSERVNRARAIVGVTLRSLSTVPVPDLEDEVQSLVVAMDLLADIAHQTDPAVLMNPSGAPAVMSARQARKEARHV